MAQAPRRPRAVSQNPDDHPEITGWRRDLWLVLVDDQWTPAADLAQMFGVHKQSVWMAVRWLRDRGISIISGHDGYILDPDSVPLNGDWRDRWASDVATRMRHLRLGLAPLLLAHGARGRGAYTALTRIEEDIVAILEDPI